MWLSICATLPGKGIKMATTEMVPDIGIKSNILHLIDMTTLLKNKNPSERVTIFVPTHSL